MSQDILIVIIVIILGFVGLYWLIARRQSSAAAELDTNQLIQTVISVAKEKLEGDKQQISADVAAKKEAIELLVNDLKKDIEERQKEIRHLEQDRNLKFGEITKSIEEHKKLTSELQGSTEELKRVLSNSQLRGSWGERQLEQIFHNAGFLEGQHYMVQHQMSSGVRPDFVVKLPNNKMVCIDAKFPYANLQLMTQAEDKAEKQRLAKAFALDVKAKINEVSGKGYISQADGTMDFAIMFIPSEIVFDHINKAHPELVDEAMTKKVIMASPYNLLAIVRTVLEAHKHFIFESSMAEVLKKLNLFLSDYRKFQEEFAKFGASLEKAQKDYDQITSTRYKQMDLHIRQIQEAHQGTKQLEAVEDIPLLDDVVEEK